MKDRIDVSILIISASITSHVIPVVDFAKRYLSGKIHIASGTQLRGLVERAGYGFVEMNTENFGLAPDFSIQWNKYKRGEKGFWAALAGTLNDELYRERNEELGLILELIKPEIIFLDVFSATDFCCLRKYPAKIHFFSPMLLAALMDNRNCKVGSGRLSAMQAYRRKTTIQRLAKWIGFKIFLYKNRIELGEHRVFVNDKGMIAFWDVPHIILAPRELDVCIPGKLQSLWYTGLNVASKRPHINVDPGFYELFSAKLFDSEKIIYCSFGSFYQNPRELNLVLNFYQKLIYVGERRQDFTIIISAAPMVKEMLEDNLTIRENTLLFSSVPQLEVLTKTHVFITHGGLGSLKESIHHNVPMLILPLDLQWDQCLNACNCESLGIGRVRNLAEISSDDLESEIDAILIDKKYLYNISALNEDINVSYNETFTELLVSNIYLN